MMGGRRNSDGSAVCCSDVRRYGVNHGRSYYRLCIICPDSFRSWSCCNVGCGYDKCRRHCP